MKVDWATHLPSFREQLWRCADGRTIRIRDMTDDHLINVIGHIASAPSTWYGHRRDYLLAGFHEEAHSRGLTFEQLGQGVRPFFQGGKLWRFSFETRSYVEVFEDQPRPRGGS